MLKKEVMDIRCPDPTIYVEPKPTGFEAKWYRKEPIYHIKTPDNPEIILKSDKDLWSLYDMVKRIIKRKREMGNKFFLDNA